jgi:hypothetical protein
MLRLELSREEAAMLRQVLESYVSDLRMEISDTDRMEFREELKIRESFLKGLIARLEEQQPAASDRS